MQIKSELEQLIVLIFWQYAGQMECYSSEIPYHDIHNNQGAEKKYLDGYCAKCAI